MKFYLKSVFFMITLMLGAIGLTAQSTNSNPANCKPSNCKTKTACCASSSFTSSIAAWFTTVPLKNETTSAKSRAVCAAKTLANNPNCSPEECAKICAANPDCNPEECAKFCSAFQSATPDTRAKMVATTITTSTAYGSEITPAAETTPIAKKSCKPANCAKSCKKGKAQKTSL